MYRVQLRLFGYKANGSRLMQRPAENHMPAAFDPVPSPVLAGQGDRTMGPLTLQITFTDDQMAAIDAWIARHVEPRPNREEAVRQIVAGRLAAHGPSTILPDEVTGRDVV